MITFNYVPKRSHFAYVNGQIHSYYKFFFIIFTKIFLTIILRRHIQLKALYNNWSLYIYLYSIGTGTLVCFLDFVSHSLIIMRPSSSGNLYPMGSSIICMWCLFSSKFHGRPRNVAAQLSYLNLFLQCWSHGLKKTKNSSVSSQSQW